MTFGLGYDVLETLVVKAFGSAGFLADKLKNRPGPGNPFTGPPPVNPNPQPPKPGEGQAADAAVKAAQQNLADQQADQADATLIQQWTQHADDAAAHGDKKAQDIWLRGIESLKKLKPHDMQARLLLAADVNDQIVAAAKEVDKAAKEAKDGIDQTGQGNGASAAVGGGGEQGGEPYDEGNNDYDYGDEDEDEGEEEPEAPQAALDPSQLAGQIASALSPLTSAAQQAAAAPADIAGKAADGLGSALGSIGQAQPAAAPVEDEEGSSKRRDDEDEDTDDEDRGDLDNQYPPPQPPPDAEGGPGAAGPNGETGPQAGAVAAADGQGDAPVDLDGFKTPVVDPQTGAAIKAFAGGTPVAEAYSKNNLHIPAPGSVVIDPVPAAQRQAGDVAVYTDKHIPYLGNGKVWNNGVQDEKSIPEAGFLGWAHPTKATAAAASAAQPNGAAAPQQPVVAAAH